MNLTELITLWIGEEEEYPGSEFYRSDFFGRGYTKARQDLKSKIPDLIEQITDFMMQNLQSDEVKDYLHE